MKQEQITMGENVKKLRKLAALMGALIVGTSLSAGAGIPFLQLNLEDSKQCLKKLGDPFPWFIPLEIPWQDLEGTWKASGDTKLFVSVKVLKMSSKGTRLVQTTFHGSQGGPLVAGGVASVPKKERIVEAEIVGTKYYGRARIAYIAFPTFNCEKHRAETALQIQLYDRKGKEILDDVMILKKEK